MQVQIVWALISKKTKTMRIHLLEILDKCKELSKQEIFTVIIYLKKSGKINMGNHGYIYPRAFQSQHISLPLKKYYSFVITQFQLPKMSIPMTKKTVRSNIVGFYKKPEQRRVYDILTTLQGLGVLDYSRQEPFKPITSSLKMVKEVDKFLQGLHHRNMVLLQYLRFELAFAKKMQKNIGQSAIVDQNKELFMIEEQEMDMQESPLDEFKIISAGEEENIDDEL